MLPIRQSHQPSSTICSFLRPFCIRDAPTHRSPVLTSVRYATHGAQGRANGPKNGPGKRLGAKKTGDEKVVTGTIIFRQRGTQWHAGDNVGIGRDHTIFALESGFVKYYRDPNRHPKKQYIGVVFNKEDSLPYPKNQARKRRLGMMAVPRMDLARKEADRTEMVGRMVEKAQPRIGENMRQSVGAATGVDVNTAALVVDAGAERAPTAPATIAQEGAQPKSKRRIAWEKKLKHAKGQERAKFRASGRTPESQLEMRPGYMYRETNYQIGLAADRAGAQKKVDRMLVDRKKGFIKKTMAAAALLGKAPRRRRGRGKKGGAKGGGKAAGGKGGGSAKKK